MTNISDAEHAMIRYSTTFEEYKAKQLTIQHFLDGWIFITLLKKCTNFRIRQQNLIINCYQKWTSRLNNIKKLINSIDEYFEQQIKKKIKIKDIDLIQIVKNKNPQQLLKLFSIVIAVMTQAPNKQQYINKIMSLDQKIQDTFVNIIKNNLQKRIIKNKQNQQNKMVEIINNFQIQNSMLRNEVDCLLNQNYMLNIQLDELKQKQTDYINELKKLNNSDIQQKNQKQKQHLSTLNQSLKQKMLSIVRQNQAKTSQLKKQINQLQLKLTKYQDLQEQLQFCQKQYNQAVTQYQIAKQWDKQKIKFQRTLQEKQDIIKQLTVQLNEANKLNYQMQMREFDAKLEIQKKNATCEELEKQVKNKWSGFRSAVCLQVPQNVKSMQFLDDHPVTLSHQLSQGGREDGDELKQQIQKLKRRIREMERENSKLKRNFEKNCIIQNEKKKLQRLVLQLNNEKKQHMELLLQTTYTFYNQNIKLKHILTQNSIII